MFLSEYKNLLFMNKINKAILFAAGYGKRLKPITDTTAKPLVEVAGISMLERSLRHLTSSQIDQVVVNTHHLYQQVEDYLAKRNNIKPDIIISREMPIILETAGGIINAIDHFDNKPFISYNGDIILIDKNNESLEKLINAFDEKKMDMLLLLQPLNKATGYNGKGDFSLDENNQVTKLDKNNYVFTGIQIIHPRIFYKKELKPESLSVYFKNAIDEKTKKLNKIYGLVHNDAWLHVGDVEGLKLAEKYFKNSE